MFYLIVLLYKQLLSNKTISMLSVCGYIYSITTVFFVYSIAIQGLPKHSRENFHG